MSIYTALNVGVLGVQAQSNAISIISDNIANANTTGYKDSVATFENLIEYDNSITQYSPNGVVGGTQAMNDVQGEVVGDSTPTNIAITGDGFFPVASTAPADPTTAPGSLLYTRAGSFSPDANGNFVNDAGYYLQAWPLSSTGQLSSGLSSPDTSLGAAIGGLQTVNVQDLTAAPQATTTITMQANLDSSQAAYAGTYDPTNTTENMASGSVAPQFDTPITVYDNTGASHTLEMGFIKTGTNTWAAEIYAPTTDVTNTGGLTPGTPGQIAAGTITFNGDGTPATISSSLQNITVNWQDGATTSNIAVNLGTAGQPFGTPGATVIGRTDGLTQFASASNVTSLTQDGSDPGTLKSVSITSTGFIAATYSDGSTRNLYQIPLAKFNDPDALAASDGDVFTQTENSGVPTFSVPDEGGVGTLQSSALESSNVDIATQLTSMIIAQQAYTANTKTITTTDEMLQNLVAMGATQST